jgi:pimeloyl-ACP methyl ester carboxylesterase
VVSTEPTWAAPQERPIWLVSGGEPVFGFVHAPDPARRRPTAVVLCPPFGWEEMCSHRARRTWAQELAAAGFATLRLDLPGAGESGGGPQDPDRLAAWMDAIGGGAAWLRRTFDAHRIAAIGIGLGGMAAVAAASAGAAVDDLILWGVPARGRTLLRELRAYAGIVAARYPDEGPSPLPEGAVEVTGFLLSAQTAAEVEQLDLTKLTLADPDQRRALLIERDALGVDRRLREHLEQSGLHVSVLEASDYSLLMAHPQEGRAPRATIRATVEWLEQDAPKAARAAPAAEVTAADTATLAHGGHEVIERPLELPTPAGRRYGMLSMPSSGTTEPVCAVLLNAGALRRIGPNRTWVEVSRHWAARGVPTVRIDFEGIGDADGDELQVVSNKDLYSQRMTDQTLSLLDDLQAQGLPGRFVLVGLCSGAYWALHAALADPRVAGAFMINLYSFHWSEALVAERDRRETVAALRGGVVRRLARGGISGYQVRRVLNGIRAGMRGGAGSVEAGQSTEVGLALDKLRDRRTEVLLALSHGEPLYDQFEREGRIARMDRWPNVTLERLPSSDHMVRALWVQAVVEDRLGEALERLLAQLHADGATAAGVGAGG